MVAMFLCRSRPDAGDRDGDEIWPNLYAGAQHRGVPLLLANARLSDKSFKAYACLRWLVGPTLRRVALVHARRSGCRALHRTGSRARQVEGSATSSSTSRARRGGRRWPGGLA